MLESSISEVPFSLELLEATPELDFTDELEATLLLDDFAVELSPLPALDIFSPK